MLEMWKYVRLASSSNPTACRQIWNKHGVIGTKAAPLKAFRFILLDGWPIRENLHSTCHLHFWQEDRDLSQATTLTWGWKGYWDKSQHRKLTLEKKILWPLLQVSNLWPFSHGLESGALTTGLSTFTLVRNHDERKKSPPYLATKSRGKSGGSPYLAGDGEGPGIGALLGGHVHLEIRVHVNLHKVQVLHQLKT